MTIREFISNDRIFNLDGIKIETFNSDHNYLLLFEGPWYGVAALKYLDREISMFYHDFKYNYTVFTLE